MLLHDAHNGQTYNLGGEPITQTELAELINQVFNTNLTYNSVSVEAYEKERKAALGDFIGAVIAGIYHGIITGVNDVPSDFEKAAGRPHKSTLEMIKAFKEKQHPCSIIPLKLGQMLQLIAKTIGACFELDSNKNILLFVNLEHEKISSYKR
jgi:hypothetical protein